MDQLEAKIVMLSRQEMASLCQALDITADMIEGSFDESEQPASPHVLRAVWGGGSGPAPIATFGYITGAGTMRQIQFALKLNF